MKRRRENKRMCIRMSWMAAVVMLSILLPGCQSASRAINDSVEVSAVKWVYMTWPLPSDLAATLYPDRDEERISRLVAWIDAARPVDGTGLAVPERSMAVNVALQDGRLIVVRPAWRCATTKRENGNTGKSCESALDRVVIEDEAANSGTDAVFAKSSDLYRLLDEGYKVWMPPVRKYEYPEKLETGAAFAVSGHGSRSRSATVTLSKGDAVLWTGKTEVHGGEWKVAGKMPDIPASGKDYSLKIQTDEGETTVYPDVN